MATYAIGDIQGCYDALQTLLEKIDFDPSCDTLWFTGDLVNRGPKSLETLRFVKRLGRAAITVLGNHDLHLLAVWQKRHCLSGSSDTLLPILRAADGEELIEWLCWRPLMYHAPELGYSLIHAGLPPQWSIGDALIHAHEVESILRGEQLIPFLENMYGDTPKRWQAELEGWGRIRYIVNCFSRLRFCKLNGKLDFKQKGPPGTQKKGYIPWFQVPGRRSADTRIIFGHWSTLGLYRANNVYGIDTGCLWGGTLTALRIDAGSDRITSLSCHASANILT